MVYRKKRYPPRNNRLARIGRYATTAGKVASAAYTGLRLAKHLATMVNVEQKYHQVANSAVALAIAGSSTILNNPAVGTGDGNMRIGDSIKAQYIKFEGCTFWNSASGGQQVCRVMLVWYNSVPGAITPADLLANSGTIYSPYSPKYHDNRFQSKVVFDKTFVLDTNHQYQIIKCSKKWGKHTQFNNGTTTIKNGQLVLYLWSDNTTNVPSMNYVSNYYYVDN